MGIPGRAPKCYGRPSPPHLCENDKGRQWVAVCLSTGDGHCLSNAAKDGDAYIVRDCVEIFPQTVKLQNRVNVGINGENTQNESELGDSKPLQRCISETSSSVRGLKAFQGWGSTVQGNLRTPCDLNCPCGCVYERERERERERECVCVCVRVCVVQDVRR